jgi:hypothetical protein
MHNVSLQYCVLSVYYFYYLHRSHCFTTEPLFNLGSINFYFFSIFQLKIFSKRERVASKWLVIGKHAIRNLILWCKHIFRHRFSCFLSQSKLSVLGTKKQLSQLIRASIHRLWFLLSLHSSCLVAMLHSVDHCASLVLHVDTQKPKGIRIIVDSRFENRNSPPTHCTTYSHFNEYVFI